MLRALRFVGWFALAATLASPGAFAQAGSVAGAGDAQLVELGLEIDQVDDGPGSMVRGRVLIAIDHGWHINSITPNDEFLIPTRLTISSPAFEVSSVEFPPHENLEFSFAEGPVAVYEGTISVGFEGTRIASLDDSVEIELYYQACDDSVCLRPATVSLSTSMGGHEIEGSPVEALAGGGASPSDSFTSLDDRGSAEPSIFSDAGAVFESRSLVLALIAVFLVGLALNLTPCVYPLIPITVGYFASQRESGARTSLLAITYVLGIAVTYSLLGVVSALSGALFGAWLQSTAVLVFFALVMLVLASSMFGMWDMTVPQFIISRAGGRAGYAGALVMGLLAGVVAAPCVGPFVASLLAFVARQGDPVMGFVIFFTLALGLGLPYLILGMSASLANRLPRSGGWLVITKKAFGFVLIGMAFYFLRPVFGERLYEAGLLATGLIGAVWLIVEGVRKAEARVVSFVLAAVLGAAGLYLGWPSNRVGIEWEPWTAERIESAAAGGEPVVIDFYADWCIPCKELDSRTFTDPAVMAEAERFVRLKADLTDDDEESSRLTRMYGIVGVPTIVFIDSNGDEVSETRLLGFEKPDRFLRRLKAVE